MGSLSSFWRKRPFISVNSSVFIKNVQVRDSFCLVFILCSCKRLNWFKLEVSWNRKWRCFMLLSTMKGKEFTGLVVYILVPRAAIRLTSATDYHRLQKWVAVALARYPGPRQSSRSVALAKRIAALGTRMSSLKLLGVMHSICLVGTWLEKQFQVKFLV